MVTEKGNYNKEQSRTPIAEDKETSKVFFHSIHAPHTDTPKSEERKKVHPFLHERDFHYIIHHSIQLMIRRGKTHLEPQPMAMQVKHHKVTSLLISAMEEKRQNNERIDRFRFVPNPSVLERNGKKSSSDGNHLSCQRANHFGSILPWFDSNDCSTSLFSHPFRSTERLQHCYCLLCLAFLCSVVQANQPRRNRGKGK